MKLSDKNENEVCINKIDNRGITVTGAASVTLDEVADGGLWGEIHEDEVSFAIEMCMCSIGEVGNALELDQGHAIEEDASSICVSAVFSHGLLIGN